MTARRQALVAEATRLRLEGMLQREIAVQMGISVSYAGDLLRDPDRVIHRASNARYRAKRDERNICPDCGGYKSQPAMYCVRCKSKGERHRSFGTALLVCPICGSERRRRGNGKLRCRPCENAAQNRRYHGRRGAPLALTDPAAIARFLVKAWPLEDGCHQWLGHCDRRGYGRFGVPGDRSRLAHRVAYATFVGEVPQGHELDHLCRNQGCVNPSHLEPVTHLENMRRAYRWCPDAQDVARP